MSTKQTALSKAMARTDTTSFDSTALTQLKRVFHGDAARPLTEHSQQCANPFCKGLVEIKSPRGKHGRYCSDRCRMDGYVLRRAKAMLDEVGIVELFDRIMESS